MKTVRLTMAQALVRFLENQFIEVDGVQTRFVRGMFIIPGHGNVVGLGQALSQEAKHLEVYQGKNEQGMAQAAVAFAKQMKRKQIFAVTSSVGPGAANMVTACGTATANNIPVLVLPGDVYACRQPDPVLQQVEQTHNLSISTNDAFKAVCRYWDRIVRPEQLMSACISAFRTLTDPANTGAVCLAMPQDVEGEAYDYPVSFFAKRVWRLERRPATEAALADAAEAIRKAKHPMLVCGGGVRYSEAHEEFKHFAEALNIPFGETQAGKSAVVWTHPLNLGGLGVTGCSAANDIAKKADLVIGVGTRYTDFTTSSKWLFKDTCKFVNINVSEFQALKLDAIPVVADAKDALPRLEKLLEGYKSGYTTEIQAAKDKWLKELERLDGITFEDKKSWKPIINDANADSAKRFAADLKAGLCQTTVLGAINAMMADEDVAIGAAGSLPGDMQRMWRPRAVDTYNMEYGYSTMGYEVAGALGVKLAIGDKREVYAFCGDGSFNMLHGELVTACQEHKKINICLFDNASFGCINNLQVGHGNVTLCTELRYRNRDGLFGDFMDIDYAKVAEAYGCKAYHVRTMEELVAAFEDAKKVKNRPVLFDIKVLPKTMTDGYGSWWRVGDTEVSERKENLEAYKSHLAHVKDARKY
ncbi:3D-(3,5/4)-trihydroxycyclohexane-1,2-dione acylhydrolase (decyclizing) [Dysosmobacter sp.]|uniref:3D-(3,5/4)-trihydroxycyclohexane-1,2-dione acylhydrolase (decyclizing) n=1 Tax=Dysosmobacter sp. TaxID=2591382 RepID=UPI001BB486BF|nr:3D-(3,5/4)-trihydroxycyclohexane-1,2-dione acylhydrolase (decyclizing) [Dysosmobacter sp.]MCI6055078.1 3D-(3,5/4)-trihydroxycyclohexane-1,2-dione acylhydrolase (decyclizing) [Dysosmobacter sp.]MDY5509649.1 3D-(3,5/4)-trihydroxycyclohexane-1,2-dione acylhydrolase (decyclizing) [Dysosmobacter sp.]QUO37436.1 3D-(3,5/4)-trihydroxycyclohexane-1,2-dione acylhydrolase (decyclizing) [Dysosmobacter sp. Marseille-Q4140]